MILASGYSSPLTPLAVGAASGLMEGYAYHLTLLRRCIRELLAFMNIDKEKYKYWAHLRRDDHSILYYATLIYNYSAHPSNRNSDAISTINTTRQRVPSERAELGAARRGGDTSGVRDIRVLGWNV
jgi:hypothetical protein